MFGFRQEPGERRRDRRRGYSFRRHFARLKQEGRLPQIAAASVALLLLGGIAFGQCRGDSITGPGTPTAESGAAGTVATSTLGSVSTASGPLFKSNDMIRPATFIGRNPCNGDLVVATGKRHIMVTNSVSSSGDFQTDEHINDSFKSVLVTPEGTEVPDSDVEYVGSDVHSHRMLVDALEPGMIHRDLTNEHLSRRGGEDHWVLHLQQRTEFSVDPLTGEMTPANIEIKGHASCPEKRHCKMPGDCPDQAFEFVPTP